MLAILREAMKALPPPTAPSKQYPGGPRHVSPGEAHVTKAICMAAAASGCGSLWTNLDPVDVAPASTQGTFRGPFSRRSYDVSWRATCGAEPEHALEVKVLPNENSGGWQTVRGFVGAAFVAGVDSSKAALTTMHAVLVAPLTEFTRLASLARLLPAQSKTASLTLEPSKATDDTMGFEQVMDAATGHIAPSTKGMVGAMFAKFPSHGKSFVGLYRRPGVLKVEWDVSHLDEGDYRAVIYSVAKFDAQIQWPGVANSAPDLEDWWP